ncbi:recombinase [Ottowia sp. SB7-C50]|uniref:site-specific recombinase n=1 Tax=Ottowia sp. SB7-C50 TaxID=3081231 RepID=UPI00295541F4|nr:recombinase [Ottowia sp. SB7-C50]WOP15821.1 recombinase [Ottowia sp. SB7-C50]
MATPQLDLIGLLRAIDPQAPLAERHLWLIRLLDWVRGDTGNPDVAVARVRMLIDAAEVRPDFLKLWHLWWEEFLTSVDATPLLADLGFSSQGSLASELARRLRRRLLPVSPETTDLSELFELLFPTDFDARWLRALDARTLRRLRVILFHAETATPSRVPDYVLRTLMDALAYATSQISAAGQSADVRLRMSDEAKAARPFAELPIVFETLRRAVLQDGRLSAPAQIAAVQLREQLDACRAAASSVYSHLEEHGISVNIEFQLRQLRQRILRVKALLLCLETDAPAQATAQLLSHLVKVSQDSASMRALWSSSTELLAAKVTERNAETGQHYITRNAAEYGAMLARAAGGGALLAGTTWAKLAIGALGLSSFWGGWWAGVNYALSFVLIMLLHWTVATKQPAMTAPAMAARLKDMATPGAVERFVDEVVYLLRSQFAAILGNVGLVMPVVVLLSMGLHRLGWAQRIMDPFHAQYILAQHNVLGPTALFAAATGVLLFASSLIAGWVENWFVFNRLDSAVAHHPRATAALGRERAARWAAYWRQNISSWTANISLGLMLGLVPPVLRFFGIPFDVRHVTLVAGQIAAAVHELGAGALHQPALAWAAGGIVITGLMNLAFSFTLAFRLALTAQNVPALDRRRLYAALGQRALRRPLSFLLPLRLHGAGSPDPAP